MDTVYYLPGEKVKLTYTKIQAKSRPDKAFIYLFQVDPKKDEFDIESHTNESVGQVKVSLLFW